MAADSITFPRAVIRDLYYALAVRAIDQSYGCGPIGDDPRDFSPDFECSTPEERAAHAEAVRKAEAGEPFEMPRHRYQTFASREEAEALMASDPTVAAVTFAGPGKPSHVNVQAWGLGVSTIYDRAAVRDLRKLLAAIKEATGEEWTDPVPEWVKTDEAQS